MRSRLAAVMVLAATLAACRHRTESRLPSIGTFPDAPVIIISIDTLRADHLPLFGYKSVETPNIDALRRDGMLFTNAWSHVPLTLPSHVTLLTGQLPAENGVRDNLGYRLTSRGTSTPGDPSRERIFDRRRGVRLRIARRDRPSARSSTTSMTRSPFSPVPCSATSNAPGVQTEAIAERWIDSHKQKPFFFLLHLFEPHAPYAPPEPYRSRFANGYDGEIATADAIVGSFLAALKKQGVYDRAIVVLAFRSWRRSRRSRRSGARHPAVSRIAPRAADREASKEHRRQCNGRCSGRVDRRDADDRDAHAREVAGRQAWCSAHAARVIGFAPDLQRDMYPRLHLGWSDLRSLVDATHHFIDAPRPELYDVRNDPGEKERCARRATAHLRFVPKGDRSISARASAAGADRSRGGEEARGPRLSHLAGVGRRSVARPQGTYRRARAAGTGDEAAGGRSVPSSHRVVARVGGEESEFHRRTRTTRRRVRDGRPVWRSGGDLQAGADEESVDDRSRRAVARRPCT